MVSCLYEELGDSFIIASEDSAIRLESDKASILQFQCHI